MLRGESVFEHLVEAVAAPDPGASSHWRFQHAGFSYQDGVFSGLQGFGGCHPPYSGLRKWAHQLLQSRYRNQFRGDELFENLDGIAAGITARQGRAYDLDVLRQTMTLAWLRDRLPESVFHPESTVCVIGDGFASMTALLWEAADAGTLVLVNLTRTLLVDLHYLRLSIGATAFDEQVMLLTSDSSLPGGQPGASGPGRRIIAIQAENHAVLQFLPANLVINMVSMGEMNPETTGAYFRDIRAMARDRQVYFYCCNRLEKRLPDGTITRFYDYPWSGNDHVLIDELCPWHQYYYSARFPFYHKYDGPVQHRLAVMSPE